jgi:GTP:adenosylcobinamide-phosphate guanylyltransferase
MYAALSRQATPCSWMRSEVLKSLLRFLGIESLKSVCHFPGHLSLVRNNHMAQTIKPFTGVVLAADRGMSDPVAQEAGVPCKSFVPVGGRPMVLRVIDTLRDAHEVDAIAICGPSQDLVAQEPELNNLIKNKKIKWIKNLSTPSSSAYHVLDLLSDHMPILVTTSDHGLLRAEIVDYFCREARKTDYDLVVGLTSYEQVMRSYPETRRTVIRLHDGGFCGCNLFAFLTPRARRAAEFWQKIENNRKKPWHMIKTMGWMVVLRYLIGRLSLEEGLNRLSKQMNLKAGAIMLPFPEAAIDVDKVSDWRLVEDIVSGRNTCDASSTNG